MQRVIGAILILVLTASAADARRRHHRVYIREAPVMMLAPGATEAAMRSARGRVEPARLIPRDWQLQPPDPNWQGRRYLSPTGDAWLALYSINAANTAQTHFKTVAFADGEEMTYLRADRDRLTVSGLKGDRIYYRKVMLACGGTMWRHIALEYPAASKRAFDGYVERMSRDFEHIAEDGCGESLFTSPPAPAQKPADTQQPKQ